MGKKTFTLSRAQINALVYLWGRSEKTGKKFLKDIGIAFTEEDALKETDYIKKFLTEEEFAYYSDTDRR